MLIDKTFFIGNINIPNTDKQATIEKLEWFINRYEPELLQNVLGYELYQEFKTGIAGEDPAQKWKDLRDGAEYTGLNGRLAKWRGLLEIVVPASGEGEDAIAAQKQSIIANYIYYFFLRSTVSQTSGAGENVAKVENGIAISPEGKMTVAWNEMVNWINELICYLDAKRDIYPEWLKQDKRDLASKFQWINPLF